MSKFNSFIILYFIGIQIGLCQIKITIELNDKKGNPIQNALIRLEKQSDGSTIREVELKKGNAILFINDKYIHSIVRINIEAEEFRYYSSELKITSNIIKEGYVLDNINSLYAIRILKIEKSSDSINNIWLLENRNKLDLKIERYSIDNENIYTIGREEKIQGVLRILKQIKLNEFFSNYDINVIHFYKSERLGKIQAAEIKYKIQIQSSKNKMSPMDLYNLSNRIREDIIIEKLSYGKEDYPYKYLIDKVFSSYDSAVSYKNKLKEKHQIEAYLIYYFDREERIP